MNCNSINIYLFPYKKGTIDINCIEIIIYDKNGNIADTDIYLGIYRSANNLSTIYKIKEKNCLLQLK